MEQNKKQLALISETRLCKRMEQNSGDRNLPETLEIYEKYQQAKLTNWNEPKQMILINRKKGATNERNQHAKPTNRTNRNKRNLSAEENHETYKRKQHAKPTNRWGLSKKLKC